MNKSTLKQVTHTYINIHIHTTPMQRTLSISIIKLDD